MRLLSICIATLLASAAASAAAPGETFLLHVPGINGDSKMAGHIGWIPVDSFSESITNTFNATSGTGAGHPTCGPLLIVKHLDTSSPKLFMAVASGHPNSTIELEAFATTNTGKDELFLHITLTNAVVSSVTLGGDATTSARTESVTLNYEQIEVQYLPLPGEPAGNQDARVNCTAGTKG